MSLTHFYPYPIMDDSPRKTFHFSTDHHRQPPPSISTLTRTTTDQLSKEPMFEKPLTPSDVGKLNRLVIPKQHAEKYFPRADSAADQQKGLLLSFEDETGKPWRFRYSYWNSSQSYVLTKGWSRYVKEKHLDAGDVVLFERHSDRFFIGWRRKAVAAVPVQDSVAVASAQINGSTTRLFHDAQYYYPSHLPHPYQPHCLHAGGINDIVESSQRDMVGGSRNPRRVRLFGVNLECPDDSEPSTPDGSSQGTSGQTHYQYYSNSNNMDINFRYHQHQG